MDLIAHLYRQKEHHMNFEDDFKKLKEKVASLPDLEKLVKQLASQGGGVSDDEAKRATLPYGGPKPRTTKPWKIKRREERAIDGPRGAALYS